MNIRIVFCKHCDGRDYPIGKTKKLGKCDKCGKEALCELLVEV